MRDVILVAILVQIFFTNLYLRDIRSIARKTQATKESK